MSTIPGYMTALEAAQIIGVDHSQVCRYCADGQIRARKVGNQWLIAEKDVRNFERRPVGNPNLRKK